ncbi:hypothetical protein NEF87_004890 [Candidatus Lokiarchaeum ossiferum]|uniref:HEPN domain-containing protein n=1 Tax=Candidatus Lokiarchaeum ossiferum TaxID=2951803 RepID=A0ABY6HYW0_9ARCH|nr:hypothetical protein NEF87_004890 [Candidatus Lokiarchaeum sp. B-35]
MKNDKIPPENKGLYLDRSFHFLEMKNEALKCFNENLFFGAIFCIHSAMTSLLIVKLRELPHFNNKRKYWRISTLNELLKKMDFIDTSLVTEIQKFSAKRGELEHPKTPQSNLFANWEIDNDVEDSPTFMIEGISPFNDGPKILAQKGISLYLKLEKIITQNHWSQ